MRDVSLQRFWLGIAAIAAALAIAGSANSEAVDKNWIGIWQDAQCDVPGNVLVANGRGAMYFQRAFNRYEVTVGKARFSNRLILISDEGAKVALQSADLEKCGSTPADLQIAFGEPIAVFLAYADVADMCASDGRAKRCLEAAFSMFDVTGNRALSRSEISRGVRVAGFFAAYAGYKAAVQVNDGQSPASVGYSELSGAAISANIFSPALAQNLLASYDYDDDGSLSLTEITTDRDNVGPLDLAALLGDATLQEVFVAGAKWVLSSTRLVGGNLLR